MISEVYVLGSNQQTIKRFKWDQKPTNNWYWLNLNYFFLTRRHFIILKQQSSTVIILKQQNVVYIRYSNKIARFQRDH